MTFTWKKTNAPQMSGGGRTDDIWFIDEKMGWAVNSNAQILNTQDGGNTWVEQTKLPKRTYPRCIAFSDSQNGWLGTLTSKNRLFRTINGGEKWIEVTNLPDEPTAICGLSVVDKNTIYASGTNYPNRKPAIIKSLDSGKSWEFIDMSSKASLLVDIYFKSKNVGWVVGGFGGKSRDEVKPVVLYTEDGGKTWKNQIAGQEDDFPSGEWGWKIHFVDKNFGYISLENFDDAAILKSVDGGKQWKRFSVDDPQDNANLEGVGFLDENTGWVGGWGDRQFKGGYTSSTTDGGVTWADANHVGKFLNRFRVIGSPPQVVYASGDTVYKYAEHKAEDLKAEVKKGPGIIRNENDESVLNDLNIVVNIPKNTKKMDVEIWDRFGEFITSIHDEENPEHGSSLVNWEFKNDEGQDVGDGHFIYRVTLDDMVESRIVKKEIGSLKSASSNSNLIEAAKTDLPSIELEKEAFHKLANIEDHPDFRPVAKKMAMMYLENAEYEASSLYRKFEYSPEAFDLRMMQIYDAVLPGMYRPHGYDQDVVNWSNGKRYPIGKASDRVVKDRLLQLAPFNLMDGVWLQNILQAKPSDEVQSRLFDIWADEVGNGSTKENHSNVYRDLLNSQGIYLPPVTSLDFLDIDLAEGAWRSPVFQSCMGIFPQAFFPELIGMTLFLEWEATPTLMPAVNMLRGRGMNPLFYSLHVAIDNISEGHGAIAKEAVKIFLEEKREEGGERAVQYNWNRIWNGYVTWATVGFNGAGLQERRLIIDRKSINLGTKENPECFPDFSKYYHDRMVNLINEKASAAEKVHGRATLDGVLLNDLFKTPEILMEKLISSGLLDVGNPRGSRFLNLLEFEGPMYRVFTKNDIDIILDWVESLDGISEECIEPLPNLPNPNPDTLAGKVAKIIEDFSVIGRRGHDELTLPNAKGEPKPLADFFDDPYECMRAMIRGGWIIPGSPERSMFLTRILQNGGPMEGIFGAETVSILKDWIKNGAETEIKKQKTFKKGSNKILDTEVFAVKSTDISELEKFASMRPFIGQGSVH